MMSRQQRQRRNRCVREHTLYDRPVTLQLEDTPMDTRGELVGPLLPANWNKGGGIADYARYLPVTEADLRLAAKGH